jgi:cell fate regulator YaaT (PSP1 superfamily)
MHNFVSVTTNAARYQEISLNPQKLAGQCGKLKCCLNFEIDSYIDAQKHFPPNSIPLETHNGTYVFLKADIFKARYWYTMQGNAPSNQLAVPVERVKEIQRLNKRGKKPEKLIEVATDIYENENDKFHNVVGQEDVNRFNIPKKKSRKKKRNYRRKSNRKQNAR